MELSTFRITFTKDLRLPTLGLHHHSSSSSAAPLYMLNYLSAVIKILTTRMEHPHQQAQLYSGSAATLYMLT